MRSVGESLMHRYVQLHNQGVRSGDFRPLSAIFESDAQLHFIGIELGPFHGRETIVEIFSGHGPDDELLIARIETTPHAAVAEVAWKRTGKAAGTLSLYHNGRWVTRLIISVAPH